MRSLCPLGKSLITHHLENTYTLIYDNNRLKYFFVLKIKSENNLLYILTFFCIISYNMLLYI